MIKKWYFCLSESSMSRAHHGWSDMVIAAVNSAIKNTNLKPYLLFDGEESPFLDILREKGVTVIKHRVGFYDALKEREKSSPGYLSIASGAFLRTEIPLVEQEDEYVLYTDCDVVFLKNPELKDCKPKFFACAPQQSKTDYLNDANSGVLVINVKKMRETYKEFSSFIVANLFAGWPGCDQENYRRFYRGKWDNLPLSMNWKPYWGLENAIDILHWHGPKPEAIFNKIKKTETKLPEAWEILYSYNKDAYTHFLNLWNEYVDVDFKMKTHGHIDSLSKKGLAGWVLYQFNQDEPVELNFYVNGVFIGSTYSSHERADLKRIFGASIGGFEFKFPHFLEGRDFKIEIRDALKNPLKIKFGNVRGDCFSIND